MRPTPVFPLSRFYDSTSACPAPTASGDHGPDGRLRHHDDVRDAPRAVLLRAALRHDALAHDVLRELPHGVLPSDVPNVLRGSAARTRCDTTHLSRSTPGGHRL